MVIDKIGNINNIIETRKNRPVSGSKEVKKGDSVQLSSEARQAAEVSQVNQAVQAAPDVRAERVQAIRDSINDGTYNFDDDKILSMVADKIAEMLVRK